MPNPLPTANVQQCSLDPAAYEAKLRLLPSYDIKAEYITQIGKCWDELPRPKIESAIQALLQHRLNRPADRSPLRGNPK